MPRFMEIRAAIQGKILAQAPQLSADASEPYCRLICRQALSLAARQAEGLEDDAELQDEREVLEANFGEEIATLWRTISTVSDRIVAHAGDDERLATSLATRTADAFIYGGGRMIPLSLEAIRARVDAGSYLLSRWGGKTCALPAEVYAQHRLMVWLLAVGCDAPGLLNPLNPEHPEGKAEMCETLFDVEIAALKALLEAHGRRVGWRAATKAQAEAQLKTLLDELQRRFVGDDLR